MAQEVPESVSVSAPRESSPTAWHEPAAGQSTPSRDAEPDAGLLSNDHDEPLQRIARAFP